jgi:N-acyl-D-amino-acid deacylase
VTRLANDASERIYGCRHRGRTVANRVVIEGGKVVDGTGAPPFRADVLVVDDRVAQVGVVDIADADRLDAAGKVVTPGFVNVLSHAYFTLQSDPRGVSDLVQGVTTEVFGEGYSLGPLTAGARDLLETEMPADADWAWPRLSDALASYEKRGVGLNVASFVGHLNLRLAGAGEDDRAMTPPELSVVKGLLDEELADGALGLGAALMYAPEQFAPPEEVRVLCRTVAEHDALFIAHIRDEARRLAEAVQEMIQASRLTGVRSEIHHLKVSGRTNWPNLTGVLDTVEAAQRDGLTIGGNFYPYTAGGTALAAAIPQQFHVGGLPKLLERLRDPGERRRVTEAIRSDLGPHENLYLDAGGATGILLADDTPAAMLGTRVAGRRLAQIATELGRDEVEVLVDLVLATPTLGALYFIASEDNVREIARRPWVCVGSDAATGTPDDDVRFALDHPRAYGTFARVLGRLSRDEGIITLPEAVRRMTSLPADRLRLRDRGRIQAGRYADIAVFDPDTVADHATYEAPRVLATGVTHVLVNGTPALRDGEPTGALPGRALRRGR